MHCVFGSRASATRPARKIRQSGKRASEFASRGFPAATLSQSTIHVSRFGSTFRLLSGSGGFSCRLAHRSRLSGRRVLSPGSRTAENLSHERGGTVCRSVYRQLLSFSWRLRAAGFDGETNRVIGVTVWSRRGFKREKTRGEIKPMPPLQRRPSRSRASSSGTPR